MAVNYQSLFNLTTVTSDSTAAYQIYTNELLPYTQSYISIAGTLNPLSTNSYNLGSPLLYWDNVYSNNVYANNLEPFSGTVTLKGNIIPNLNDVYTLGTSILTMQAIYSQDLYDYNINNAIVWANASSQLSTVAISDTNSNLQFASGTLSFASSPTFTNLTVNSTTTADIINASGLITGTAGLTISNALIQLNAGSNFGINICTGSSTGNVSIKTGTGTSGFCNIMTGSSTGALGLGSTSTGIVSIKSGTSINLTTTGAVTTANNTLDDGVLGAATINGLLLCTDGLTVNGSGPVNMNNNTSNNVNILTGASSGNLNLIGGTGTGTITIGNSAAGNVILNSTGTINIGGSTTGVITIESITVPLTLGVTGISTLHTTTTTTLTASGLLKGTLGLTITGANSSFTSGTFSTTLGVTGISTQGVINASGLITGTLGLTISGAITSLTTLSTSGLATLNSLTITASSLIANTYTYSFPTGTDTLVTLTAAQTLTNKTLTSPIINTANITGGTINNASIGATTASSGAFTTLSASGTSTLSTINSSGIVTIAVNNAVPLIINNTSGDNTQIAFQNNGTTTAQFGHYSAEGLFAYDATSGSSGYLWNGTYAGGMNINTNAYVFGSLVVENAVAGNGYLRFTSAGSANYIESGLTSTGGSTAPLIFTTMNAGTTLMTLATNGSLTLGTGSSPSSYANCLSSNGQYITLGNSATNFLMGYNTGNTIAGVSGNLGGFGQTGVKWTVSLDTSGNMGVLDSIYSGGEITSAGSFNSSGTSLVLQVSGSSYFYVYNTGEVTTSYNVLDYYTTAGTSHWYNTMSLATNLKVDLINSYSGSSIAFGGTTAPVSNADVPVQIFADGSGLALYGAFVNSSTYGMLIGIQPQDGVNSGVVRMVNTYPLKFLVNSTTYLTIANLGEVTTKNNILEDGSGNATFTGAVECSTLNVAGGSFSQITLNSTGNAYIGNYTTSSYLVFQCQDPSNTIVNCIVCDYAYVNFDLPTRGSGNSTATSVFASGDSGALGSGYIGFTNVIATGHTSLSGQIKIYIGSTAYYIPYFS